MRKERKKKKCGIYRAHGRLLSGSCGPVDGPGIPECAPLGRRHARPASASRRPPIAIFLLPVFAYISMHIEREHVFNGNHGKMNYTDSVRDLMIYVHNTLKQMTGAGTQLKVEERRRGEEGGPPGAPHLSPGAYCGKQPRRQILVCELSVWPGPRGPRAARLGERRRGLPPLQI